MSNNFTVKSYRREYHVLFEQLSDNLLEDVSGKSFLFIDSKVNDLYPIFAEKFESDKTFVIHATEENKTLEYCQDILKKLVEKGIRKNHKIVAVGGGVVQDITAFISSVLYRGIEWQFFPTTLLAQADSCIGSKSSINFAGAKNLLGTFYPPSKIFCCVELLKSLSKKDIKSGVGEILHYFIVEGSPNTKPLMDSYESILDDYTLINPYIIESLGIKKKMIEKDEFDEKQRIIFNYGHTFGHAIETITDYKISHGQAVTLGMDMANYISASLGFIKWDLYVKIHNIIKKNIPSFRMGVDEVEKYIRILSKDKKNIDDSITCILLDDYGDAKVRVIKDKDNMKNLIVKYFRKEDR